MSARSHDVPDEEAGIIIDPEGGYIEGADDMELTEEKALETEMTNPEENPNPENPDKDKERWRILLKMTWIKLLNQMIQKMFLRNQNRQLRKMMTWINKSV